MVKNKTYELGRKHIIQSGLDKLYRLVEYYNPVENAYAYAIELFSTQDKSFKIYKPFAFKSNAEGFFNRLGV
jgi:hypothetical protein